MTRWLSPRMLAAAVSLLLAGCGGLSPPNWFHPGPAPYQRREAVDYDPYPLNDLGPPVIDGRPREFQAPHSEVKRARPRTTAANPWAAYTH